MVENLHGVAHKSGNLITLSLGLVSAPILISANCVQVGFPVDTHIARVLPTVIMEWMPGIQVPELKESDSLAWKTVNEKSAHAKLLYKAIAPVINVLSVVELRDLHVLLRYCYVHNCIVGLITTRFHGKLFSKASPATSSPSNASPPTLSRSPTHDVRVAVVEDVGLAALFEGIDK